MFIGRYYHTIEEKGRVSVPKKFRDEGGSSWVVTRGIDGGLFLFIKSRFALEIDKLSQHSFTQKANRDTVRLLANDAMEAEIDDTGRFLIPETLRATAQLTKNVVIVGSNQYLEIWDVELYHTYLQYLEEHAVEITEKVRADA